MPYVLPPATPPAQRRASPSDLSDPEYLLVEPLLPVTQPRGQVRLHSYREILNAIFYYLAEGCRWRSLPHDLPAWQTVATYFYAWRDSGLLDQIHAALRASCREVDAEREAEPTAAIVDSQSVKTSNVAQDAGYDGGKKGARTQAPPAGGHRRTAAGGLRADGPTARRGRCRHALE
jgi:putative transposase